MGNDCLHFIGKGRSKSFDVTETEDDTGSHFHGCFEHGSHKFLAASMGKRSIRIVFSADEAGGGP